MRKELAFVLLLVGLIIVAFGGLEHAVLKIPVMQHTSTIIGAVGVIIALIGVWGFYQASRRS